MCYGYNGYDGCPWCYEEIDDSRLLSFLLDKYNLSKDECIEEYKIKMNQNKDVTI
jgi:hypothetical protein